MRTPALDLTRYHAKYERGDLIVFLTWWTGDEDMPRPCIALLPARRQSWEKAKPAVVVLEQAYQWDEATGDPRYCARLCFQFAEGMGMGQEPNTVMRIRSAIHDHLGDLINMPPLPHAATRIDHMGDMTIKERETGKVREIEVTERV